MEGLSSFLTFGSEDKEKGGDPKEISQVSFQRRGLLFELQEIAYGAVKKLAEFIEDFKIDSFGLLIIEKGDGASVDIDCP